MPGGAPPQQASRAASIVSAVSAYNPLNLIQSAAAELPTPAPTSMATKSLYSLGSAQGGGDSPDSTMASDFAFSLGREPPAKLLADGGPPKPIRLKSGALVQPGTGLYDSLMERAQQIEPSFSII